MSEPSPIERFIADLDPVAHFEADPIVQQHLRAIADTMRLTPAQRMVVTSEVPPRLDRFRGRTRVYVGPAIEGVPTQADLDRMTRIRGISNALVWTDEMEEPVRDEFAEEARRRVAAQEQADRAAKDQRLMASMNRAQRRAYLRGREPR